MELLLLSNSTSFGDTMFHHAATAFREVVGSDTVTFVPFALTDWDGYVDRVTAAFGELDIPVMSAHRSPDPARAILDADVVMIGGGNSFRLLDSLLDLGVLDELADQIRRGATRYLGASAGTNLACPSIRTTNDMPIRDPATLSALEVLPFQINPHFVDADPESRYMGETRDDRIAEFLEDNDCAVLAMYEGTWLRVSGVVATLHGPARLFTRDRREDVADGGDLSHLLSFRSRFDCGRRPDRLGTG